MARLRHALTATLALVLAVLLPRVTRAQSCHAQPPQELRGPGWWLALSQETARFESSRFDGHYQGVLMSGGVAGPRLSAGLALAAYRIVRNGLPSRGLGDLSVHSRALLVGANRAQARAGLILAVTLPTGDARADLGMGHVMLMPGVWAAAQAQQLSLSSQITYGKSLSGNNAHHHHGSVGPLVAPMSASELDATLSASVPIYPSATRLRLRSGVDAALPILDAHAAARAELILGLLFGDRANTSVEGHLPITGEPSTLKLVLSVGIR